MKKMKIIGIFGCFILSVILHFIYEMIPITLISIMAPVNESIWEHMKLIVTSSLIFCVIEYLVYKIKKIPYDNLILSYSIAGLLSVILYLLIYIPLNDIFGHKVYIAIGLLFLIFIFLEGISYYMMNSRKINYGNEIGILVIIMMYFFFGYFTYHPPRINLFYDYLHKQYGILKE